MLVCKVKNIGHIYSVSTLLIVSAIDYMCVTSEINALCMSIIL